MYKREFEKIFQGSHKTPAGPRKMCDENETNKETKKRNDGCLKYFDGRKEFIRHVRKTRVMDIKRLQVNDSLYIEGTICLVNE